ncbi:MAG: class I SAM-dependent methyltransferase [Bacteroidota bacterium]
MEKYPGYKAGAFFDIYHCSACDTSFCDPMNSDVALYDFIYENKERIPGYSRYMMFANNVVNSRDPLSYLARWEDVYYFIKHYFEKKGKNGCSILEIGSGLGYVTYALAKRGYDIKGMDISDVAVANARKKFGDHYICRDLFEYVKDSDEKYDVIIMTELVEHVQDIPGFLNTVKKLLKDNGEIILTTPNKDFYPKSFKWQTDAPPVHFWWLSNNSLRKIAERVEMKIDIFDFSDFNKNYYPIVYGKDLSLNPGSMISENGDILKDTGKGLTKFREFLFNTGFLHVFRLLYAKMKSLSGRIPDQRGVICAVLKK